MNIQDWFPLGLTGLISLLSKGVSRVFFSITVQKHQLFFAQLSHPYTATWKTTALTIRRLLSAKWCLCFLIYCLCFVIAFLSRNKHLLILQLTSPSSVILEPKEIKSLTGSIVSSSACHEVMGLDAMIFIFWMLCSSQLFHSPLSVSSRCSLVPLCFLPLRWYHLHNYTESRTAGSYDSWRGKPPLFSTVVASIYTPIKSVLRFPFSTSLPTFVTWWQPFWQV